jgi:hypothetical protein
MIHEIDQLLEHWAEQHRRRGGRQQSALAVAMEFGGVAPRGSGPKGSRDLLNLGDLDNVAWEVEQALNVLDLRHQAVADEHYRRAGSVDVKALRLGMARRTYYDALHALHATLKQQLRDQSPRRRQRA